jgi:hypothetical protein
VCMIGGELQLLQQWIVLWLMVLVSLLGALDLERDTLLWLAIGSNVCF